MKKMNVTCVVQSPGQQQESHLTFVLALITLANTSVHILLKVVRIFIKRVKTGTMETASSDRSTVIDVNN